MNNEEKTKADLIDELNDLQKEYNSQIELCHREISDLRQEKEKISKSEQILRIAYKTSPDSVNINRLSDGMYVSINEGFTNIMGYTEKDAIGRTSLEMNIWVNPDDRANMVKELQANGKVKKFEARFLSKEGRIVHGLLAASLIDLDGVAHIITVVRDVTLYKKAEEALAKERFLINALMNNLSDHVYFKNLESKFIRTNRSHANSFGLDDPDQVIGKSDFDFFAEQAAKQAFEDEQLIIKTGQLIQKEERLIRKDNSAAWFSAIKMPLHDNNGKIIGTFGISRDITKSKLAEEELLKSEIINRTLIKHLPQRIFIKDPGSKYILCNDIYSKDLGINPLEIVGKDDFAFFPRELAEKYQKDDQMVISEGVQKEFEEKYSISNEERWTHVIKVPYRDANDHIVGVLGIFEDITNRKLAEEEIQLKNELLQTINLEKDKFFSILAHDLRGPLSAFVAATQILTEEIQTMDFEEIKEITLSMKTSATNIYSLLENLLEWSRLRRGGMEFIPVKLNLKNETEICIGVLLESARKKGIEIMNSIPGELEVIADNHMFESVIRNLITNAIKFTVTGGKVNVIAGKNGDHFIEVKISDSGIGMAPELKEKLFQINEKTNRPGTEGEPSTGLGLLLCKEFIEKCGGRIWVESEAGKGSVFSFTLPEWT